MGDGRNKNRFRFTAEYDLHLAREVLGLNPYEDPRRWATIQVNIMQITGQMISVRTLRERIQNLITKYLKKAQSLEGKSGIEIEVTELDDILHQISDLIKEFKDQKASSISNTVLKTSYSKGQETRERACAEIFKETSDIIVCEEPYSIQELENENIIISEPDVMANQTLDHEIEVPSLVCERTSVDKNRKRCLPQANVLTPVSKRKRKDNGSSMRQLTLNYLETRNEQQHEIRQREIRVAERKILLEERQFELEKHEREKRLELEERRLIMEEKNLNMQLELFKNQQDLMKIVLRRQ